MMHGSNNSGTCHADAVLDTHAALTTTTTRDNTTTTAAATRPSPLSCDGRTLAERLEAKMFAHFTRRCATRQWLRGCAVLSAFASSSSHHGDGDDASNKSNSDTAVTSLSPFCVSDANSYNGNNASTSALNVVDVTLWNRYWEAYTECYGDGIASLAQTLCADVDRSGDAAATATHTPAYRRLLLRVAYDEATSTGNNDDGGGCGSSSTRAQLASCLLHAATRFGAIEHAQWLSARVWSVQFTTCAAAALMLQWVHGQSTDTLLQQLHCSNSNNNNSTSGSEKAMQTSATMCDVGTVRASLAPHDPHVATSRLMLGRHVRLSTPFAQSLLCGVFDATAVQYERDVDGLIATFASSHDARVALHALQHSLDVVFGIALTFA